jgi:hypothetical protein
MEDKPIGCLSDRFWVVCSSFEAQKYVFEIDARGKSLDPSAVLLKWYKIVGSTPQFLRLDLILATEVYPSSWLSHQHRTLS